MNWYSYDLFKSVVVVVFLNIFLKLFLKSAYQNNSKHIKKYFLVKIFLIFKKYGLHRYTKLDLTSLVLIADEIYFHFQT
jgi:hypothetical protein